MSYREREIPPEVRREMEESEATKQPPSEQEAVRLVDEGEKQEFLQHQQEEEISWRQAFEKVVAAASRDCKTNSNSERGETSLYQSQPNWKEQFEREVKERSKIPLVYPTDRRERKKIERHTITSADLLELYRLDAGVNLEGQVALEPYLRKKLDQVQSGLYWAYVENIGKGSGYLSKDPSTRGDIIEAILRALSQKNEPLKTRMWIIDQTMYLIHERGWMAQELVRDFKNLSFDQIKDFFDKLENL